MISRCEKIRQYLKSQGEPQPAGQVAIGIGMPGDIKVYFTLATMCREGSIKKEGSGKKLFYSFVHDVKTRCGREQAAANQRAYELKRNAQRRAEREARAAGKPPKRIKPPKVAKPAAVKKAAKTDAIRATMDKMNHRHVAVANDKRIGNEAPRTAETVDEFLARGGQVQVLHPWDTSKPLRFLSDRYIELD